ncbi:MAG: oligosaccharide flippase family protein [Clostridia bacterium]|nr:oligosaccharide flippase family protein [Clostridia bacterium]
MKQHFPQTHSPRKPVRTAFTTTATFVTALSIAERGLGFLYRIVLSRLLGAEGLGLYQVALSLFAVFLTLGTGGIPITVSRLIAKSKAENNPLGERSAVGAGVSLSLLLTLPFVLLFEFFPALSAPFFSDERGIPVFRILLLGLCFSALYAVFRGSFWGNKRFLLPSVLEISEESVMVIAGVLLLQNVQSPSQGANLAAWAVVISYLFSFTASFLCFLIRGGKFATPKKQLKPLFNATLPITSVRVGNSLVASAVAVLLPVMLVRTGASEAEALTLLGIVSGMAMPVLFIPSTIIGSLSLVLVPELAEDYYRKNTKRLYQNLARGLTVAFLVACFLTPFFYAVGEALGALAFSEPLAGEFIRKGCPLLLPMSLAMISTGMLNSMGYEKQTFLFYFVGAAAMLICILTLPAFCGAYAYVIGLGANFLINAVCNLVYLGKKCPDLFRQMRKSRGVFGLTTALKGGVCVLPLSFIGALFYSLFSRFCGAFLSVALASLTLALTTAFVWLLVGIFPKRLFKHRKKSGKTPVF